MDSMPPLNTQIVHQAPLQYSVSELVKEARKSLYMTQSLSWEPSRGRELDILFEELALLPWRRRSEGLGAAGPGFKSEKVLKKREEVTYAGGEKTGKPQSHEKQEDEELKLEEGVEWGYITIGYAGD
jgi:hypothetical protein